MPQLICAASNAGPAGAAVQSSRSDEPSAISQLVPTSMKSRSRLSRVIPVASSPATMSPPTYAPRAGKTLARARGWRRSPSSEAGHVGVVSRGHDEGRHADRLGIDAERELRHRRVAGERDLVDLLGLDRRLRRRPPRPAPAASRPRASRSRSSASASSIVAEMRVITSAPNGCWRLSIERTATGVPVPTSSSVATTVVVPRSNAIAWSEPVVSPGSTSISRSSTTTTRHAVVPRLRRISRQPSQHARPRRAARGRRRASRIRSRSVRWSASEGSSSST